MPAHVVRTDLHMQEAVRHYMMLCCGHACYAVAMFTHVLPHVAFVGCGRSLPELKLPHMCVPCSPCTKDTSRACGDLLQCPGNTRSHACSRLQNIVTLPRHVVHDPFFSEVVPDGCMSSSTSTVQSCLPVSR